MGSISSTMPAPASGTYTSSGSPATFGLNAPTPVWAYTPVGLAKDGVGEAAGPCPGDDVDGEGDDDEPGPAAAATFGSFSRTTRAPSARARVSATMSIALGNDGGRRPMAMKRP